MRIVDFASNNVSEIILNTLKSATGVLSQHNGGGRIRDIPATKVRAVSRSLVILFLCIFLSDDDGGGDGDGDGG